LKKLDVWIVLIVFAVAAAAFALVQHARSTASAPGGYAEVYVKNELVETIDLRTNGRFAVKNEEGYNLLEVEDGGIRMAEADCLSQTCVHAGAKSMGGEIIVCLPNRVVVKIVGAPEGVDTVAN
jgi:hypothetical protein